MIIISTWMKSSIILWNQLKENWKRLFNDSFSKLRYFFSNESQLHVFVLITTAGYDLKPFSLLAVQWKEQINDKLVCLGEQGCGSAENAPLPPMCPGFDSHTRRRMWQWVCCWFSSLLRDWVFLQVIRCPSAQRAIFPNSNLTIEWPGISERVLVDCLVLRE